MIVPMKKTYLVVMEKEKRSALKELGKLGLLHVETIPGTSEELESLERKREMADRALNLIPQEDDKKKKKKDKKGEEKPKVQVDPENPWRETELILQLNDRRSDIFEEIDKLNREKDRISSWGDFDPDTLHHLALKDVHVGLYEIPAEKFEEITAPFQTVVLTRSKSLVRCALVESGLDLREISSGSDQNTEESSEAVQPRVTRLPSEFTVLLPEMSLSGIVKKIGELKEELAAIEAEIEVRSESRKGMEEISSELGESIEFERVHLSMQDEEEIAWLKGFIPEESAESLKEAAAAHGWGVMLEDVTEEDATPSLVRNPRWISIIKPVFNLLGTVPGYREFDISFFFLFFLTIFFAMIIGDAGYGSILFIISLIGIIKGAASKKGVPQMMSLLMVFGIATIVWGAITGTWFGAKVIVEKTFLSRFVIPQLASFNPRSGEFVKFICFVIGTVHLSIAHLWNFISEIRKKPRIRAFAQLGWFSLVLGLYYLVLNLVLSSDKYPMPKHALYMIIAGIVLIVFFANQEGKFFKGLVKGIGGLLTTFIDSIGAFSDIISYIRLFAVGLASVEIAKSFNGMAAGPAEGGAVGLIAAAVILVFGHTLNLGMGALSVIVHGVRLNMLEFSGHLGMEWTGIPYTPFSVRKGV